MEEALLKHGSKHLISITKEKQHEDETLTGTKTRKGNPSSSRPHWTAEIQQTTSASAHAWQPGLPLSVGNKSGLLNDWPGEGVENFSRTHEKSHGNTPAS
ncbi:hypothetical protein SRHO_G00330790 [Serrasalmus rhombeus]